MSTGTGMSEYVVAEVPTLVAVPTSNHPAPVGSIFDPGTSR